MNLPREKVTGPIPERRRPGSRRNSRHEIRMSYGFHSSERINRRRTKISIHRRSRSHSVTVVHPVFTLHFRARSPRAFRLLEARTGYHRVGLFTVL